MSINNGGGCCGSTTISTTGTNLFGDGTVSAPSITFLSEATSGIYRVGAGDVGVTILGTKVADFKSTGLTASLIGNQTGNSTGTQTLPDGTVGTPSLNFTNETNSGIYRVSNGDIGIAIGGTKVVDITSSGISTASLNGITSGTYTPTVTPTSLTVNFVYDAQYMKIGNIVMVSGSFTNTFTAANCSFTVSLPVAPGSNFIASGSAAGMAQYMNPALTVAGAMNATIGAKTATGVFVSPGSGSGNINYQFMYSV